MDVRTDLAIELHADAVKRFSEGKLSGISITEEEKGNFSLISISVDNDEGEQAIGRPKGHYITVEFGRVGVADTEKFTELCTLVYEELSGIIKQKCGGIPKKVLITGLGNADITADSVGPLSIKSLIVTGHLKTLSEELFQSFGGVEITALSMGVMAQTGMESAQVIKSVCDRMKPELVVAVDALASNMLSRLARTLQISDTGIRPGSGIGNFRCAIDEDFLGVPVISVGVPTMVEVAALVADVADELGFADIPASRIREKLGDTSKQLVTPKDSAVIIADIAKLIGFALNRTFIPDISFDEIARLTG